MSSSSSELQVAVGMPFDCHDKRIPVCRPMYLFLSSCTRPLSYEGRPCGFGLGRLIVWSIFHFFLVGQKKLSSLRDRTIFFCPLSWLFFVQSLIRGWPIFKKNGQKKSIEWTKKLSGLWGWTILGGPGKKKEKLTRQLVGQRDWPKVHGLYCEFLYFLQSTVPTNSKDWGEPPKDVDWCQQPAMQLSMRPWYEKMGEQEMKNHETLLCMCMWTTPRT